MPDFKLCLTTNHFQILPRCLQQCWEKQGFFFPEACSLQTEASGQSESHSCNCHFQNMSEPQALWFLEVPQGKSTEEEWCQLAKAEVWLPSA